MMKKDAKSTTRRAMAESLEGRVLFSVFTVTNNADSLSAAPAGSLRWTIIQSNSTAGVDTIAFNLPANQRVIKSLGEMPSLWDPVVLNAATQPGYAGKPLVQLDGSLAGKASGLRVYGGNTVRGLAITNFAYSGIDLYTGGPTARGSTIAGNWIGLDLAGNAAGNNANGIYIATPGNLIGGTTVADRNVISASRAANGIFIQGTGAGGNIIQGNYLGTDPTGTQARANFHNGVGTQSAPNTQILGNVISGNNDDGILLQGAGSSGNIVQGNLVGVNASGTGALGNRLWGLEIQTDNNTIGGNKASARNVFSANGQSGIVFYTAGSTKNTIIGNYIGTDITGNVALGNTYQGIAMSGATGNSIVGNLISGNKQEGIGIFPSNYTTVQGNVIGFSAGGKAMPNATWAVVMVGGSTGNVIGGTAAGQGNYIATHPKNPAIANSGGNTVVGNVSTPPPTTPTTPPPPPPAATIAGSFGVASATYTASETAGWLNVVVTRSAGTNVAANVNYGTVNGTALAGSDYTAMSGTLTFAAGQTAATVKIPLLNDSTVESNETFKLALSAPTAGATLTSASSATITLTSDDVTPPTTKPPQTAPAGVFKIAAATYEVAENLGTIKVVITRTVNTAGSASVKYATGNGTAAAGSDFTGVAGTLSFAAGQTAATLRIPIINDSTGELNEAFTLALGNARGATLGNPSSTTITILNDDSMRSAKAVAARVKAFATRPISETPAAETADGVRQFLGSVA